MLAELTRRGIPATPQWGVAGYRIDFALADPDRQGRMVLALEVDGDSYHRLASARDRDRLRQSHLENMGWDFHRVWVSAWFTDPDGQADRIERHWKEVLAAPRLDPESPAAEDFPAPAVATDHGHPSSQVGATSRCTQTTSWTRWPGGSRRTDCRWTARRGWYRCVTNSVSRAAVVESTNAAVPRWTGRAADAPTRSPPCTASPRNSVTSTDRTSNTAGSWSGSSVTRDGAILPSTTAHSASRGSPRCWRSVPNTPKTSNASFAAPATPSNTMAAPR